MIRKNRYSSKARRVNRVSATRRLHVPRKPHPGQPQPSVGARARVQGHTFIVTDSYKDRVALVGPVDARVPIGLLVHWLNWSWRVLYNVNGIMFIEGWGPSFVDSDKMEEYV